MGSASPSLMLRTSATTVGLKSRMGVTLGDGISLFAPAMRLVRPSRALSRMTRRPGFFGMWGDAFKADGTGGIRPGP